MHPNKGSRATCFAVTLTVALVASAAASSRPTIAPNGPAWKVKPAFEKSDKVREAISGAACAPTLPPTCLAVNDEKNYAQFFAIKGRKIVPRRLIRLEPDKENGVGPGDLDTEGAAYDRGFFYVAGSHGAPRNPAAAIDPSRFFVLRFRVNERTGKPRFRFGDEVVDTAAIVRTNTLREVIRTAAEIGPFAEKPLGENGANIEGIAVRDDRIYLGFRGPSLGGRAFILAVNSNGVFGNEAINLKVHPIRLGPATGIRDLAVLRKTPGMLVLTGPVGEFWRLFRALLGRAINRHEAAGQPRRRAVRRQARDPAVAQREQRKAFSRAGADREHRQRQSAGIPDPALTVRNVIKRAPARPGRSGATPGSIP